MLKHHLATCMMATALVAAPALAQTNQAPAANAPAGQNTTTTTQPAAPATTAPSGSTMPRISADQGASAPMQGGNIQYITQNRPDLWRASKLEGINVYNGQNEKVGDIREVLVNEQGQVEAVVIGVGGFLGIGERDVAVPFNALQWVQEERTAMTTPGTSAMAPPAPGQVAPAPRDTTAAAPPAAGTTGGQIATGPATPPAARNNNAVTTTGSVGDGGADTRYDQGRDYPERAILAGATKDQLKEAPEFQYSR